MRYLAVASGFVLGGALISTEARASEETGLDLGVRLGYGIPLGSLTEKVELNTLVTGQIPLWVDLGYRFTPNIMAGVYFSYGFALVNSSRCLGSSCSASDNRFGIQGQYRFMPSQSIDPWLGLGIGYEWLDSSESSGGLSASASFHGWEFVHVQGGVDFKVGDGFGVGPFLAFSLAQYDSGSGSGFDLGSVSGDIPNTALHEWLTFGVRAVFDP